MANGIGPKGSRLLHCLLERALNRKNAMAQLKGAGAFQRFSGRQRALELMPIRNPGGL